MVAASCQLHVSGAQSSTNLANLPRAPNQQLVLPAPSTIRNTRLTYQYAAAVAHQPRATHHSTILPAQKPPTTGNTNTHPPTNTSSPHNGHSTHLASDHRQHSCPPELYLSACLPLRASKHHPQESHVSKLPPVHSPPASQGSKDKIVVIFALPRSLAYRHGIVWMGSCTVYCLASPAGCSSSDQGPLPHYIKDLSL